MWTNLQFTVDLFTFTKGILNGKLYFLCSVCRIADPKKSANRNELWIVMKYELWVKVPQNFSKQVFYSTPSGKCYIVFTSENRLKVFTGNKAKKRILKWRWQEKKACQIFWKTSIFYPWYANRKIWTNAYETFGAFCFLVISILRCIFLPCLKTDFLLMKFFPGMYAVGLPFFKIIAVLFYFLFLKRNCLESKHKFGF